MALKITCRYGGETVDDVVLADDADWNPEIAWCPKCGAAAGEECSSPEGNAMSPYIHNERESEQAHLPREET